MTTFVRAVTDRLFQQLPGELVAFTETGGGVFTMFVGPVEERSNAWAIAIGPFDRTGDLEAGGQVYVGYDVNNDLGRPDSVHSMTTVSGVVEAVVHYHDHICSGCGRFTFAGVRSEHADWPIRHVLCPECAIAQPRRELDPTSRGILVRALVRHEAVHATSRPTAPPPGNPWDGLNIRARHDAGPGEPLVEGRTETGGSTESWCWRLDQEGCAATRYTYRELDDYMPVATLRAIVTEHDTITLLDAVPA